MLAVHTWRKLIRRQSQHLNERLTNLETGLTELTQIHEGKKEELEAAGKWTL
jgi:hypothetical protein